MRAVYIDRKNADLDAEAGALIVRIAGERPVGIPLASVERMVVRGTATVSTALLTQLWERDAGLLLLGGRRGEASARLLGRPSADGALRLAQARLQERSGARVILARGIVEAKLRGQIRLLERALAREHGDRRMLLRGCERLRSGLHSLRGATEADLPRLMGIEGAAAAAYFEGFATLFAPALGFSGRNRRPPRDGRSAHRGSR